jgi:hypothetical protein
MAIVTREEEEEAEEEEEEEEGKEGRGKCPQPNTTHQFSSLRAQILCP